ncbi:MAG: O-methyltransferase [Sporichthyaceae bacterium]
MTTITGYHSDPGSLVDSFVPEDDVLLAARKRAADIGIAAPSPGVGAVLRLLAATLDARSIVEVGTGTGVSGIWLLRGMRSDGVLTSVDAEPEYQRLARTAFTEAGVPANRARLIAGRPAEVLPRLTDAGYDLLSVRGDGLDLAEYLREAPRLLRDGGIAVFADVSADTGRSAALAEVGAALLESEDFAPALLPLGGGLLVATKRPRR